MKIFVIYSYGGKAEFSAANTPVFKNYFLIL